MHLVPLQSFGGLKFLISIIGAPILCLILYLAIPDGFFVVEKFNRIMKCLINISD